MRDEFLPFSPPFIGQEEIDGVVDSLRSGWNTTGPKTKLFEKEFAAYLGAPAALAVNSCTAALHLGLVCNGIGPGDEVITTPMTFAATAGVIEHAGATPVFADIEPDTMNIEPVAVCAAVTPRTKAVICVHYAEGIPAIWTSCRRSVTSTVCCWSRTRPTRSPRSTRAD
jgi:dTDP-4-amino-4,6-dideoxygalactose transaminase